MTLLTIHVWHALKLLLALQGTVAIHKARFGGLSDIKVSLQSFSGMSGKNYSIGWHLANLLHTVKGYY